MGPHAISDYPVSGSDTTGLVVGGCRTISGEGAPLYALDGVYRVRAAEGCAEIELIEDTRLARSVVYVWGKRGGDIIVNLPPARYRIQVRSLVRPVGEIVITRVTFLERLNLYAKKCAALAIRPQKWMSIFATVLQRMRSRSAQVPVAMRTGRSEQRAAPPEAARFRPPFRPSAETSPAEGVSIIIPTRDGYGLLKACIESLSRLEYGDHEIVIVDNGSTRPEMISYLQSLAHDPRIRICRLDIPFNFSRLCNAGAALARHPLLLFLNDDIEALDGSWLTAMVRAAREADVGAVGARLLYPSRQLQHAGIASNLVPGPGHPWRGVSADVWKAHPLLSQAGEVDAVTAACLMTRRELFEAVGGFDEDSFPVSLNDVDYCLRLRQSGLKVIYVPEATLLHKEGQSRRPDDSPEECDRRGRELAVYYRRHRTYADTSCFYPQWLRRDTDRALDV